MIDVCDPVYVLYLLHKIMMVLQPKTILRVVSLSLQLYYVYTIPHIPCTLDCRLNEGPFCAFTSIVQAHTYNPARRKDVSGASEVIVFTHSTR